MSSNWGGARTNAGRKKDADKAAAAATEKSAKAARAEKKSQ